MRFKNRSLTLKIHPLAENVLNVVHRRNTHENEGKNLLFQTTFERKVSAPTGTNVCTQESTQFFKFSKFCSLSYGSTNVPVGANTF